ncbi:MAG: hypothetical protein DRO11_05905 [Methanobacteriota archaeon]|nr:MAG: hypothetical protein DRO11_05905 [Euryarchaeota archaeon]
MAQQRLRFGSAPRRRRSLCLECRGYKHLCGKRLCPIVARTKTYSDLRRMVLNEEIVGSTPPAVFVGVWGYPKVFAGPMVPPLEENTSHLDDPSTWLDKPLEEILSNRLLLLRGKLQARVTLASYPDGLLAASQELAMSSHPVQVEMCFSHYPRLKVVFSDREPPMGPSAPVKNLVLGENPRVERPIDRVVSDGDLHAQEAVKELYFCGVSQQQIMRLFSIGLLGIEKQRRLVPTRWSITAIDDILAKFLREKVLEYPLIHNFQVFGFSAHGNTVLLLLLPSPWMFEGLEAWHAGNPLVQPYSDHELSQGRKNYAKNLEGAYYATRLPVLEYLHRQRRQAGAIVFLEVDSRGWIPLGVWRFREILRRALQKKPECYDNLGEALHSVGRKLFIPLGKWLESSHLLKMFKHQKKLSDFL